jgi:hypothetical protein
MSAMPVGVVLSPDSVQDLFKFNKEMYMDLYNADTFLEAKHNQANLKNFNTDTYRFERNYIHISDWRSLPHPPVKEFSEGLVFIQMNLNQKIMIQLIHYILVLIFKWKWMKLQVTD